MWESMYHDVLKTNGRGATTVGPVKHPTDLAPNTNQAVEFSYVSLSKQWRTQ